MYIYLDFGLSQLESIDSSFIIIIIILHKKSIFYCIFSKNLWRWKISIFRTAFFYLKWSTFDIDFAEGFTSYWTVRIFRDDLTPKELRNPLILPIGNYYLLRRLYWIFWDCIFRDFFGIFWRFFALFGIFGIVWDFLAFFFKRDFSELLTLRFFYWKMKMKYLPILEGEIFAQNLNMLEIARK